MNDCVHWAGLCVCVQVKESLRSKLRSAEEQLEAQRTSNQDLQQQLAAATKRYGALEQSSQQQLANAEAQARRDLQEAEQRLSAALAEHAAETRE